MKKSTMLVVVILIVGLPLPVSAAGLDDLDALAWLAGCWQGEGGGGKNEECWVAPKGGVMLGISRVISEQDAVAQEGRSKDTMFEFLRIAAHGAGLAYFASPRGRSAVAFPLVESGDGFAVFANPEHDFPQRLTYRRDGDAMTARIEAQRDGEWKGFDVAWRLTAGGWAASPGASGSPGTSDADLKQQVWDVETAFAKTMADRDHEAFSSFLAGEAIFLSSATARGRDQIAAQWHQFFEPPAAPFSWRPETVEVLDSGGLALSTGPVHDAAGKLLSRFTSIWRQEAPGQWRIVFDAGSPVCSPSPD